MPTSPSPIRGAARHGHVEWPPRFQFASDVWPGLAKLGEECCELGQVVLKIIGTAGTMEFRDGQVVDPNRLIEEMGDVEAALVFVRRYALTAGQLEALKARRESKIDLFEKWREEEGNA